MNKAEIKTLLDNLFNEAQSEDSGNYIFTLLRINGITLNTIDPLLELREKLQTFDAGLATQGLLSEYCSLSGINEPLSLIANILNCIRGKPYNLSPFQHLCTGHFPNFIKPTTSQVVKELVNMAMELKKPQIAQLIEKAYPSEILDSCASNVSFNKHDSLQIALEHCRSFLSSLLEVYFSKRLEFSDWPRFHKLPRFEVMELLINDVDGLYGLNIHFSNGNKATFARHRDSTECRNIRLGVPISFMTGSLDNLRHEWRVGEKRLYEIGIPGRYNKWGEWKPLIYPGNIQPLEKDARSLSQEDDVQGILLYMMCTGYRGIEFVVRTNIELPTNHMTFGGNLHLWKCPSLSNYQNIWVYDGWLELDSVEPENIRSKIAEIGINVNRMAFSHKGVVDWRVKYRIMVPSSSCAMPSEEDLHILDSMLKKFPRTEDAIILNAAIDWYNRGRSFRNPFAQFLHYYIAFESVALAIADGDADFGLGYTNESKGDQKKRTISCIQKKYNEIYSSDPSRFVSEAYFDCVLSLKNKTRRIAELIFGSDHQYINALFEKTDGNSLSDIRGKLAHGKVTLIEREDETLVGNRLHEIADISREFLIRIIFFLKPNESLPSWSQLHSVATSLADPRNTLVSSDEKLLPTKDWKIKPEWCE